MCTTMLYKSPQGSRTRPCQSQRKERNPGIHDHHEYMQSAYWGKTNWFDTQVLIIKYVSNIGYSIITNAGGGEGGGGGVRITDRCGTILSGFCSFSMVTSITTYIHDPLFPHSGPPSPAPLHPLTWPAHPLFSTLPFSFSACPTQRREETKIHWNCPEPLSVISRSLNSYCKSGPNLLQLIMYLRAWEHCYLYCYLKWWLRGYFRSWCGFHCGGQRSTASQQGKRWSLHCLLISTASAIPFWTD